MTRVVIIGAGGHGREVLQALRDAGGDFYGFLDDHEPDQAVLGRIGATWLGPVSRLSSLTDTRYLIGIGVGETRRRVDEIARGYGLEPFTLVHPMASVGPDVELEPGVIVFAFATVTTNISVGRHSHIGRGAAVGHDSRIEDFVSIYPLAAISGNVTLESGVTVGTTASVKQGLRVGAGATVGSGAAVVSDVPPQAVAVGVPARTRSGGRAAQ